MSEDYLKLVYSFRTRSVIWCVSSTLILFEKIVIPFDGTNNSSIKFFSHSCCASKANGCQILICAGQCSIISLITETILPEGVVPCSKSDNCR